MNPQDLGLTSPDGDVWRAGLGGIVLQGKQYPGGAFIPTAVVISAMNAARLEDEDVPPPIIVGAVK